MEGEWKVSGRRLGGDSLERKQGEAKKKTRRGQGEMQGQESAMIVNRGKSRRRLEA